MHHSISRWVVGSFLSFLVFHQVISIQIQFCQVILHGLFVMPLLLEISFDGSPKKQVFYVFYNLHVNSNISFDNPLILQIF